MIPLMTFYEISKIVKFIETAKWWFPEAGGWGK